MPLRLARVVLIHVGVILNEAEWQLAIDLIEKPLRKSLVIDLIGESDDETANAAEGSVVVPAAPIVDASTLAISAVAAAAPATAFAIVPVSASGPGAVTSLAHGVVTSDEMFSEFSLVPAGVDENQWKAYCEMTPAALRCELVLRDRRSEVKLLVVGPSSSAIA